METARRTEPAFDSSNMASLLMLLSRGRETAGDSGRVFECKTCNKTFRSFQALGGHRASHKKPRLSAEGSAADPQSPCQHPAPASKPRVHECSICGLEFSVGQALGGHMRRHRAAAHGPTISLLKRKPVTTASAKEKTSGSASRSPCLYLDLNELPPESDIHFRSLSFSLRLPTVDCFL